MSETVEDRWVHAAMRARSLALGMLNEHRLIDVRL